jgi:hypothetical protein
MEHDTNGIIRHLYNYTVVLNNYRTDITHFHQYISNFPPYIVYSFLQVFKDFWRFAKLFALQLHRARAPTGVIKQYSASMQYSFLTSKNAIYEVSNTKRYC